MNLFFNGKEHNDSYDKMSQRSDFRLRKWSLPHLGNPCKISQPFGKPSSRTGLDVVAYESLFEWKILRASNIPIKRGNNSIVQWNIQSNISIIPWSVPVPLISFHMRFQSLKFLSNSYRNKQRHRVLNINYIYYSKQLIHILLLQKTSENFH